MAVYEATTKKDYEKAVAFINSQPEDSQVRLCWTGDITLDWFLNKKKAKVPFHVYIVEDGEEILAVLSKELHGFSGLNEPKISTNFRCCMRYEDSKAGNYAHFKRAMIFSFKEDLKKGIEFLEVTGLEHLVKYWKNLLGEHLKSFKENEVEWFGKKYKIFTVRVDIRKALEKLGV